MKLIESQTYLNLAKAFAGECQARVRYEFIEYGARQQGYKAIAEIIDKIIYNEFNHARMFYTKLQDAEIKQIDNIEIKGGFPFKEKWDLAANLKLAAEDEAAEVKLYPEFAAKAKEEGFPDIATLFKNIAAIEKQHQKTFTEMYKQLNGGSIYKKNASVKWKCPACGYETIGKAAFKTCPVCGEKQGSVLLVL